MHWNQRLPTIADGCRELVKANQDGQDLNTVIVTTMSCKRTSDLTSPNDTPEGHLAVVSDGKCLLLLHSSEQKEMLKCTNVNKIVQENSE